MSTPVLIVGFKRYNNILKLLLDLKSSGISKVYLALDGILETDLDARRKFLADLEAFDRESGCIVEKWIRPKNLGPAVSIITAIDWFFSKEESGVILEDDLEIGSSAMPFFQKGLREFREDLQVGIIAGSNYWDHAPNKSCWSRFPITWGWATWKNRWEELRQVFFFSELDFLESGKLSERLFWKVGLHRCLSGDQDAWDIPFASYFRNTSKVCVFPPVNLISNTGVDEFAGNTLENKWPLFQKISDFDATTDSYFENMFNEDSCLDSQILREIYCVTNKNVISGILYFGSQRCATIATKNHNSLAKRILSVEIP